MREYLRGGQALVGELRYEADRLALVRGERIEPGRLQCFREQGVVADLRMGVEGEVVGGEGDVRLEEDSQAAGEDRVDGSDSRAPEEAVMDEQQLSVLRCGQLEELGMGRDARGDRAYIGASGDLQAVQAVVLEALRLEQAVQLRQDLADGGGHVGEDSARWLVGYFADTSGRGAAW